MNSETIYTASVAGPRSYGLGELIALNDELIALVKSGVPIERGLLDFSGDLSGRLKTLTATIGERVARGESLPDVLASRDLNLPPVYAALVSAGMRSGRLTVAMEQLAESARRIAEMRRLVMTSLLYPLLLVWVACSIIVALAPKWVSLLQHSYWFMRIEPSPATVTFVDWLPVVAEYAKWFPYVFAIVIVLWWLAVGRAVSAQPGATARGFRWVPGVRSMLRTSSSATFCEILHLLIAHGEPLPSALRLAGETSGDPQMAEAARLLGERLARGERIAADDPTLRRIPALLRWMLAGQQAGHLHASAMKAASESYRQRTLVLVEWMSIYVPMLIVVAIGGVVVALVTLGVIGPWTTLLDGLSDSIGRGASY